MKKLLIIILLITTVAHAETYKLTASDSLRSGVNQTAVAPLLEGLTEQMQKDDEVMALISALQDDPEMQSLLSDPAVLNAVQTGDVSSLMANPAFLRMLNNPRVQEIEKRLTNPGGRAQ